MLILTAGVASFFWFDKLSSDDPTSLRYDVVPTIVSIYNKIKARCLIGQLPFQCLPFSRNEYNFSPAFSNSRKELRYYSFLLSVGSFYLPYCKRLGRPECLLESYSSLFFFWYKIFKIFLFASLDLRWGSPPYRSPTLVVDHPLKLFLKRRAQQNVLDDEVYLFGLMLCEIPHRLLLRLTVKFCMKLMS